MSLDEEIYVGILGNLKTHKGNGEKINMKVSNLVKRTSYVCCNCLNGECDDTIYGTTAVKCMDIPINNNSGLLQIPTHTCSNYN